MELATFQLLVTKNKAQKAKKMDRYNCNQDQKFSKSFKLITIINIIIINSSSKNCIANQF